MSFQPFAAWSTPSVPASLLPTATSKHSPLPLTPGTATVWTHGNKENEGIKTGGPAEVRPWKAAGAAFTPLNFGEREERNALSSINTNGNAGPSLGLASPFVPPDPTSMWGPPYPSAARLPSRQPSMEERLAEAEKKIRDLIVENDQLRRQTSPICGVPGLSPTISTHSSTFFDPSRPRGYHDFSMPRVRSDDESYTRVSGSPPDYSPNGSAGEYTPPAPLIASVINGTFNFLDMPPEYMRSIVWVIAHVQPRTNNDSAGLKTAVNAMANRLSLPRESVPSTILINAVIEWAKDLCFTSCGNYLCQQLLERGDVDDKLNFIGKIKDDLVAIASDKFGTHVLCRAIAIKELEEPISHALLKHGVFESLKTGARRLWREYLEKCRQAQKNEIFETINKEMTGRWADLACHNEHGSIAVQQVCEVYGNAELMEPCFQELLAEIPRIANNQFGHFVVTKLLSYSPFYRATCDAIITAYPPVATSHHGVNFSKIALQEGGKASVNKYIDAICCQDNGRTPGIVAIATSSIGKTHLTYVLSCLTPSEHVRVRQVCRAYSTTLRNSQSGNDLLRALGLIHAQGSRPRALGM